jgi:hypothetical protein
VNIAGLSISCPELVADPSALLLHAANAPAGGSGIRIPVREAGDFHAWFVSVEEPLESLPEGRTSAVPQESGGQEEESEQRRKVFKNYQVNEALISNQDNVERDGLRAIAKIILDGIHADASSAKPDPASMLSQYLTWRSTHSITPALWIVVRILKNNF